MILDFQKAAEARRTQTVDLELDFRRTALQLDAMRLTATALAAMARTAGTGQPVDPGTAERLFVAFAKLTEAEGVVLNADLKRACFIADRVLEGLPE